MNCCRCTWTSATACFRKPVTTALRFISRPVVAGKPSRENTRLPYFHPRSKRCPKRHISGPELPPSSAWLQCPSPTLPSEPLSTRPANGKSRSKGQGRRSRTAMVRRPRRAPMRRNESDLTRLQAFLSMSFPSPRVCDLILGLDALMLLKKIIAVFLNILFDRCQILPIVDQIADFIFRQPFLA